MANPQCNAADGACAWTDGNDPGPCTATKGVLSLVEIQDIISTKKLTPVPLKDGTGQDTMMKQITWDNQWMGYDDYDTIQAKAAFASSHCFGGTMSWSVDLEVGSITDNAGGGKSSPPSDPASKCSWSDWSVLHPFSKKSNRC